MTNRAIVATFLATAALAPCMASAQDKIPYETGEYEYAQPLPELDNDVVTETVETDQPARTTADEDQTGAARVIPARRQPGPVFVSSPRIQPVDPSAPEYSGLATDAEPVPVLSGSAFESANVSNAGSPQVVQAKQPPQVIYAYPPDSANRPTGSDAQVVYRTMPLLQVATGHASPSANTYLPAGSRVVAFDRTVWLNECAARLDTYETDSDRGKAIGGLLGAAAGGVLGNRVAGQGNRTTGTLIGAGAGALAGATVGDAIDDRNSAPTDSYAQCSRYLDGYLADAQASAGTVHYTQPGDYMLLPVTVAVPQRAVYSDGTPVD